ncbi:MAG TPA: alginate lyase family protein [Saprospiraceae bacterium]|nr:alginate lyase family protein [Saprospiraceae bacterium]
MQRDLNNGFNPLVFKSEFKSFNSASEDAVFTFLNLKHWFLDSINWDFSEHGKLWNYNLQYFNYLHQDNISNEVKLRWLEEIGNWLHYGSLKLEPYPVSLRVMNMIRYFSGEYIQDKILQDQAYGQLNFLANNLEFHILGNHLLENGFALFMGGFAFNNVKWQKRGKSILYSELNEQILEDGAHYELSPMYHQIVLFRLLELIDWYEEVEGKDLGFSNFVKDKAIRMLAWLENVTFKKGDLPHFNDSTNGIACSSQELFDLAFKLGLKRKNNYLLSMSGYRKFANQIYECVLDSGSIIATYQPGHSHADIFSFVLYCENIPVIVDTGLSTYERNNRRNHERSTSAHNTIEIGNEDQFEVWDVFRVGGRADVSVISETSSTISASHNGYKNRFNAIHERKFHFNPEHIKIVDLIHGSNTQSAKSYLHFHPDCKITEMNGIITVNDNITISFENQKQTSLESYKLATEFNSYQEAVVSVSEFDTSIETLITFVRRA